MATTVPVTPMGEIESCAAAILADMGECYRAEGERFLADAAAHMARWSWPHLTVAYLARVDMDCGWAIWECEAKLRRLRRPDRRAIWESRLDELRALKAEFERVHRAAILASQKPARQHSKPDALVASCVQLASDAAALSEDHGKGPAYFAAWDRLITAREPQFSALIAAARKEVTGMTVHYVDWIEGALESAIAAPRKPSRLFTLIGRPTLVFQVIREYDAAGFIPSVQGRTLDGKHETCARVADIVWQDEATA